MKKNYRIVTFIFLIIFVLAGCTDKNYSFEDENIVAYIDGRAMYGLYGLEKTKYIEMKTTFMQFVSFEYADASFPEKEEIIGMSYHELYSLNKDIYNLEYARKYLEMSFEEKEIDYYSILLRYNENYNSLKQDESSIKSREEFVDEFIENSKNVYEDTILNSLLVELAKKNNITLDEVITKFYKPFIPLYLIDELLVPSDFILNKYDGEVFEEKEEYFTIVITNENNEEIYKYLTDIKNFWLKSRQQYIQYIANELSKDDVIDRPDN